MPDSPTLDGPRKPPASGGAPQQVVLFLHGVGADGNDLIGLAPYFQRVLPDALFISPDAPFRFDMAPVGRQWFSLSDFSMQARLSGVQSAAPALDAFIDETLAETGLGEDKLALIGFSQGTMMALYVGLRRERQLAAIVGYSGMLVGEDLLAEEIRSRPPVLLTHGDADEVLSCDSLPEADRGLKAAGVDVKSYVRPGLGHGIDDQCIHLGMKFLTKAFGVTPDE